MKRRESYLAAVMVAAGLTLPAAAQDGNPDTGAEVNQNQPGNQNQNMGAEAGGAAPAPYDAPDDSWITLTGTVQQSTLDSFELAYNDAGESITVEMDDWDNWGDAAGIIEGDEVTVTGRIDDDLFDLRTIEASSVYVENLDTHFFASAADEEDATFYRWTYADPAVGQSSFTGMVTDIDVIGEDFVLDTGLYEVRVDTGDLSEDPFDNEGFLHLEEGARVSVSGSFETEFLESRELMADNITVLDHAI